MSRRTKIVCTLGPASSTPEVITALVRAGMDVARMNFSHGSHDDHRARIQMVRDASALVGRPVAILQDLQGPKIRVGEMQDGGVLLHVGQTLTLTSEPLDLGTAERAYISYDGLADEVEVGRRILLDDGNLEVVITDVRGADVVTEVVVGGPLKSRKGVNLPNLRSARPSMTSKDLIDLDFGLGQQVDFIALSFVRAAQDVADLAGRIGEVKGRAGIIAKIEKPEAVTALDEIVAIADGVMVARGDLGIEMPMAQVPNVQKQIIRSAMRAARPVITATQMLESMIENPRPTRAEATDVANAVLDGTDAVMLSAETAAGRHPVRVVETMAEIIVEAERHRRYYHSDLDLYGTRQRSDDTTHAIALTACTLAEQIGASAIACLTSSGTTARAIARHRPGVPIVAFTDTPSRVQPLALLWGTEAYAIPFQSDTDAGIRFVREYLVSHGIVRPGERVVFTGGMPLPEKGSTNMVHVTTV